MDICERLDFYKEWNDYKELKDVDKQVFEQFFDYIIKYKFINQSNQMLAEQLDLTVGRIQNILTRLEDHNFIIRYTHKIIDESGNYKSQRFIKLNPIRFPWNTVSRL